jgi:hypothetical protein
MRVPITELDFDLIEHQIRAAVDASSEKRKAPQRLDALLGVSIPMGD